MKDNSKGLLRALVLSSEVVKCQIKLDGDKSNKMHLKGESSFYMCFFCHVNELLGL